MKKTLIALLAISSVAMAATKADIDTTDTSLVSYWNFAEGNADTKKVISWNELPTLQPGGYAIGHPYTSNAALKAADGFTVSFDVKDITQVGTILSMTNGNMGQPWRSISLTLTSSEDPAGTTATAKFHGAPETAVVSSVLDFSDWTTLTLVGSANGSTLTLDFYVDGNSLGSSVTEGATNITGGNVINNLQFGYYGNANNHATASLDNILIYRRALNATEVKGLIANNVPEPTTGTLSLLALAGLCIRRRK